MSTRADLVRARAVYESASRRASHEYRQTGEIKPITRHAFAHSLQVYMDTVATVPLKLLRDGDLDMRVLVDLDRDLPSALLSATRRDATREIDTLMESWDMGSQQR